MTGYRSRRLLPTLLILAVVLAVALPFAIWAHGARAQAAPALSDESLLSMVLPPLADGSRPPVHLWARADQSNGPGGLPTVFIVTLYTHQTAAGSDEREVVNYVQYSGGSWAPARPQDPGTLLTDDWAWVSLNLVNLTALAQGQGDASQYTVDYDAKGTYNGTPRELVIEEVYGSDLSLQSSSIVSDSAGQVAATASPTPNTTAPTPAPTATSALANTASPSAQPAPATSVAAQPATATASAAPVALNAPNTIRSAPPTSADMACGPVLTAQGYTWNGETKSLGAISGQPVLLCVASGGQGTATPNQSYGCLLVGGQTTTLDGSTACFTYTTLEPQGDGNFLLVHQSSGDSAQVQPIAWGAGGFSSGQPYTACTANIAIPVTDTSACATG